MQAELRVMSWHRGSRAQLAQSGDASLQGKEVSTVAEAARLPGTRMLDKPVSHLCGFDDSVLPAARGTYAAEAFLQTVQLKGESSERSQCPVSQSADF